MPDIKKDFETITGIKCEAIFKSYKLQLADLADALRVPPHRFLEARDGGYSEAQKKNMQEMVEEAHVCVVHDHAFVEEDLHRIKEIRKSNVDVIEDLSFKVCSFEGDARPLAVVKDNDSGMIDFLCCVVVRELRPREYEMISYQVRVDPKGPIGSFYYACPSDGEAYRDLLSIVIALTEKITVGEMGFEKTKDRIKLCNGVIKKIKHIVHIIPKRIKSDFSKTHPSIDWSHQWEVRGHWRVIEYLNKETGEVNFERVGKDRYGEYNVEGYTWVASHVKGPDHLPLVKKTRVFPAAKQGA